MIAMKKCLTRNILRKAIKEPAVWPTDMLVNKTAKYECVRK